RAVPDPHVVADSDVALVDALLTHRPVDLHDAVIEVDQHHAVGNHALAPDRHVLERGDRALLADDGLGPDRDDALVCADLRPVPDPRPAAELDAGIPPDLKDDSRADEGEPVELEPAAVGREVAAAQ